MNRPVASMWAPRRRFKSWCSRLAEEGKACVFISSELEEVLRTSHRIVVLREREKVAEFAGEVDEKTIIQAIAGSES